LATDILFYLDPEMGGDLTSPVPTCPANTAIGCTESTALEKGSGGGYDGPALQVPFA